MYSKLVNTQIKCSPSSLAVRKSLVSVTLCKVEKEQPIYHLHTSISTCSALGDMCPCCSWLHNYSTHTQFCFRQLCFVTPHINYIGTQSIMHNTCSSEARHMFFHGSHLVISGVHLSAIYTVHLASFQIRYTLVAVVRPSHFTL